MSDVPYTVATQDATQSDPERGLTHDPDGPVIGAPSQLPILAKDPGSLPSLIRRGRLPEWLARFLIVVFAAAIYLPNIGSFGLWDPWETHYGEVTRYMIETGDWVHPWWGYRGPEIGGEKGTGEKFHSKPILLFWMEAATIKAIGLSETAIRLPVALLGILCVFVVYYCFSTLLGQGAGFLCAGVLGSSPLFYFLARQAQTDMPFVANMTMALSFFCLAVFGPRVESSARRTWTVFGITWGFILLTFLPQLGIISADIAHDIPAPKGGGDPTFFATWRHTGWMQALTWLGLMTIVIMSIIAWVQRQYERCGELDVAARDTLRRRCYLWLFYTFCAIALMGKGLLGFMLPGAIIFVYLLITNEWSLLAQPNEDSARGRVELLRGIAIFLCVGLPWYIGLLSGPDGKAFWNRFFIHDHFNRLGSGVHAIDDGTFEHFLKWLGYGMWPWVGFMPIALISIVKHRLKDSRPQNRLRLFLFLWYFIAFTLFTLSSTKFHHYIFPALPPLAILIGWTLWDLRTVNSRFARIGVVMAALLVIALGYDIHENPQHLRNQFTYKYDREWPDEELLPLKAEGVIRYHPKDASWSPDKVWSSSDFYEHTPDSLHEILENDVLRFPNWLYIIGSALVLGLILMLRSGVSRIAGTAVMLSASAAMGWWCLSYYMPMLGPHWSQKYLFDRYFDVCVAAPNTAEMDEAFTPVVGDDIDIPGVFEQRKKKVCQEEIISWLLTWRGEAFYSHNTIRPIQKENKQFQPWLEEFNKGARFFVHIERTRAKGFDGRLKNHFKKVKDTPDYEGIDHWEVTLEHNENYWFVLLKAEPICKKSYTPDRLGRCKKTVASL